MILYKRALDRVITEDLRSDGLSEEKARERAAVMSCPVYSSAQSDAMPSEDPWVDGIRADLRRYALDAEAERRSIAEFGRRDRLSPSSSSATSS